MYSQVQKMTFIFANQVTPLAITLKAMKHWYKLKLSCALFIVSYEDVVFFKLNFNLKLKLFTIGKSRRRSAGIV